MTLIYILTGLAVVYTAYLFGVKKRTNKAVPPVQNNLLRHDSSVQTHKNHSGYGCC
ncbi:MAG: hypothetical protein M1480_05650 [Bacteroidetes bacterium]|nr:hypothetical protein [Bacteroidota bacterium]